MKIVTKFSSVPLQAGAVEGKQRNTSLIVLAANPDGHYSAQVNGLIFV